MNLCEIQGCMPCGIFPLLSFGLVWSGAFGLSVPSLQPGLAAERA